MPIYEQSQTSYPAKREGPTLAYFQPTKQTPAGRGLCEASNLTAKTGTFERSEFRFKGPLTGAAPTLET